MEKPTGGEWRVATHAYNDHWRGDGTEVLSDYGRIAETSVSGLRDPAECRANARLIAAAPDLLNGCRALLGLLQLITCRDDISPELQDVLRGNHRVAEAQAALEKAVEPREDHA